MLIAVAVMARARSDAAKAATLPTSCRVAARRRRDSSAPNATCGPPTRGTIDGRDREGVAEHEIVEEHDREDRELEYLEPEDNEAHAAGKVCERCGAVITAGQDVRLLADGHWAHEVRP
jgi:hypothetical protein